MAGGGLRPGPAFWGRIACLKANERTPAGCPDSSMSVNAVAWLSAGLILGFIPAWIGGRRYRQRLETMQAEFTTVKMESATFGERVVQLARQNETLTKNLTEREARIESLNREIARQQAALAELETRMQEERKAASEKLALLGEAKDKLAAEFQLLANRIFEEKSRLLTEQSRRGLDEVLKPMREQLGDFRKHVDELYTNESKDRAALREHLQQLRELNQRIGEEALNLTQALKGESKAQGNWGEMVLERLLEATGLREGHEFAREQSFVDAQGRRQRPDVVVYMPGDKQVIIDSKVSLTDYEKAVSATDEGERQAAVKAHLRSLKQHIQELAAKRYDHLPKVHSPDYVLMFIPIEGAYLMAIEADQSIFENAFETRIAVVTPSTLYATLKLIEQLWRYERQSENVRTLIDRAGKLHDKMVDFVKAFEEIGERLEQARRAYDTAHGRIKSGRGNVLGRIHELGRLAGKTKKELPAHLVEAALEGNEEEEGGNPS